VPWSGASKFTPETIASALPKCTGTCTVAPFAPLMAPLTMERLPLPLSAPASSRSEFTVTGELIAAEPVRLRLRSGAADASVVSNSLAVSGRTPVAGS
jgi:hypothetical protein